MKFYVQCVDFQVTWDNEYKILLGKIACIKQFCHVRCLSRIAEFSNEYKRGRTLLIVFCEKSLSFLSTFTKKAGGLHLIMKLKIIGHFTVLCSAT